MAQLNLKNLMKRFGNVTAINDVSLSISDGEFIVLVGPSGCGKSTLLRMIAGLETISSGDLIIGDVHSNDVPPQKRDISMVFQSYALFPHMTVRKNIEFGPVVRKESKETTNEKIEDAARILHLSDYLDRYPKQLSGGQRQRVAMGRSIVRDPKVFLFDEPLSNLDAKLRVQMRTEIKALHQALGTTIVYVTHDQIEAMTMADRIVIMNNGAIEQIGTPLELYDRPVNKFVAAFMGSPPMSFLSGHINIQNTDHHVELANGTALAVCDCGLSDNTPITIGIRPESFVRDDNGPLDFSVSVVEPTGPEIHLFGEIAGAEVRVILRDRLLPKPGDVITLSVAPDHIHLFDTQNDKRLTK